MSELIVSWCLLLSCYAEDLERVPLLADLKNLPVAPLDLLVCLKVVCVYILLIYTGTCG